MATETMNCNAVNHKFLASSFNFCHECGAALRGDRLAERTHLLNALTAIQRALSVLQAVGFTQDDLQEIADVCIEAISKANRR